MKIELEKVLPADIEARSFEIIGEELKKALPEELAPIIKRVIHTTADFDYSENLVFSENCIAIAREAIKNGACIVTDTTMAMSGINKTRLKEFGGEVFCFIADENVRKAAAENGTTRAVASMEHALTLKKPLIFAIGNAPTALIRLYELINEGKIEPKLIIGAPVGFVNVVQSKELIMTAKTPYIVARGRKGGSNVAAAIVNALIYGIK